MSSYSTVTAVTESQLQAQFWEHVWNNYQQLRFHMWAVPNGGNRNPVEAAKLKATGLLSGVWDLHLFWKGKLHIIETKLPGNSLTVTRIVKGKKIYGQKEWGELMAAHGAIPHIYHTLPEGIAIIEKIILT